MVRMVVKLNKRFIPPYGSGEPPSTSVRLRSAHPAQVGVSPSKDYMVIMFATPVGPYFKGGFKPTKVCISRDYDRVAPKGTGAIKIGGNYAASLNAGQKAQELGYSRDALSRPERKQISRRGAAPPTSLA